MRIPFNKRLKLSFRDTKGALHNVLGADYFGVTGDIDQLTERVDRFPGDLAWIVQLSSMVDTLIEAKEDELLDLRAEKFLHYKFEWVKGNVRGVTSLSEATINAMVRCDDAVIAKRKELGKLKEKRATVQGLVKGMHAAEFMIQLRVKLTQQEYRGSDMRPPKKRREV